MPQLQGQRDPAKGLETLNMILRALAGTPPGDPSGESPHPGLLEFTPLLGALPGLQKAGQALTKVMTGKKPTMVYHGTPTVFESFNLNEMPYSGNVLSNRGIHFSENPKTASGYAQARLTSGHPTSKLPYVPNVRPAFLDITHPLDVTNPMHSKFYNLLVRKFGPEKTGQELQRMGFDGIKGERGEWIALRPEQVVNPFHYIQQMKEAGERH